MVRNGEHVAVHVTSDRLEPVIGELTVTLQHFDGTVLAVRSGEAEIGANMSAPLQSIDISKAEAMMRETFVRAVFACGDGTIAENALLLAEPKDLFVADPGVTWRIESNPTRLHITSVRFAPYVWLRRRDNRKLLTTESGRDNFFHLFPGETKTVPLYGDAEEIGNQLVVRWL
jgi:hypothetical protein